MARYELKGKTALITGGAQRLGKETTMALAAAGCHVIIHYNASEKAALALCQEIKDAGGRAHHVQADLAVPGAADDLIGRAAEMVKNIDILINNASIFPAGSLHSIDREDFMLNMQVNAWSPFILSRSFARAEQEGRIINFLDTRIRAYDKNHAAYHLSKKALETLTRLMAMEFAPRFTVNAVAPGLILPPKGQGKKYLEDLKDTNPLKTYGDVSDITDTVIYLLTSTFVTGQVVFVDGGRHLSGVDFG